VKSLTDPIKKVLAPGPIEHRVRYYLNLVQALGGDAYVKANFRPRPLPPAPENVTIAWAPESEFGESYQWPQEKFEQLKKLMDTRLGSVSWVRIEKRQQGSVANPSGELAACSALLACDGEVAHWAAHIGLPAVVLFGPGEPAWKRPLGKQSRVLREHVACSPCYLPKCPLDLRCQHQLSVEDVADALEQALSRR
jgi:ADP-heptose:LPS heptosyltransferase